ncbi:DUF4089 domain-containing protein [Roseomonas sp. NAR14]|uniref:DUF4089 domain-containing protein n=1 Tax=Roseomonas acroporae TaxID=2937791 RepID=A0A9X1Y3W6_9PROT|nr:DUF4089 domain-containing protein [Roseomonas acroporae]MCK8783489.1 DUF4089 domain-containing protein [Roseomonas acroporae]
MPADPPPFDPAAYVDAAAALLGLEVRPEWREGVVANLQATAAAARLMLEFPLPDELDAAPVFRA